MCTEKEVGCICREAWKGNETIKYFCDFRGIFYLCILCPPGGQMGAKMSELTQEKREAIEVMREYLGKLIPGMETLSQELEYDRKPDTDDFLKNCIDGLNWVIEIYNRIADALDEGNKTIDKEEMNPVIMELGLALQDKEDVKIAEALRKVIPFLTKIKAAVQ